MFSTCGFIDLFIPLYEHLLSQKIHWKNKLHPVQSLYCIGKNLGGNSRTWRMKAIKAFLKKCGNMWKHTTAASSLRFDCAISYQHISHLQHVSLPTKCSNCHLYSQDLRINWSTIVTSWLSHFTAISLPNLPTLTRMTLKPPLLEQ